MPRAPRVHFAGALFHAMARGNGGQRIFFDDRDYQAFLDILADVKSRKPFHLYAYCLMPNHVHLLIEAGSIPIWVLMHRLLTRYAKRFNFRRKCTGHLFQGRYKAILCQKQTYLLELLRYIHLNPVRASLAAAPSDWRWSGYLAYLNDKPNPLVDVGFPLSCFSPDIGHARQLYARFLQEASGTDPQDIAVPSTLPCLGSPEFQGEFLEHAQKRSLERPAPPRRPLLELARDVANNSGVLLESLAGGIRRRSMTKARHRFLLTALDQGHKASDIAAFLNCSPSAVSKTLFRLGR